MFKPKKGLCSISQSTKDTDTGFVHLLCFESENEPSSPFTCCLLFLLLFFYEDILNVLSCDFYWNGFSLRMRCFQLSHLCIFQRKQAKLVSLSGDGDRVTHFRGKYRQDPSRKASVLPY